MEIVARDLKALGSYLARTLSFKGVKFESLQQTLNTEQLKIYDTIADSWRSPAAVHAEGTAGDFRSDPSGLHAGLSAGRDPRNSGEDLRTPPFDVAARIGEP